MKKAVFALAATTFAKVSDTLSGGVSFENALRSQTNCPAPTSRLKPVSQLNALNCGRALVYICMCIPMLVAFHATARSAPDGAGVQVAAFGP